MRLSAGIGHNRRRSQTVYAIAFDLDTSQLEKLYPNSSWRNAYTDVRKELESHGFDHQQGSVYFGTERVDAVTCVLAVQALSRKFDWFSPSVHDIRMLRIEENNDLGPAIGL
jgi:virulence-associated protein VapD